MQPVRLTGQEDTLVYLQAKSDQTREPQSPMEVLNSFASRLEASDAAVLHSSGFSIMDSNLGRPQNSKSLSHPKVGKADASDTGVTPVYMPY